MTNEHDPSDLVQSMLDSAREAWQVYFAKVESGEIDCIGYIEDVLCGVEWDVRPRYDVGPSFKEYFFDSSIEREAEYYLIAHFPVDEFPESSLVIARLVRAYLKNEAIRLGGRKSKIERIDLHSGRAEVVFVRAIVTKATRIAARKQLADRGPEFKIERGHVAPLLA